MARSNYQMILHDQNNEMPEIDVYFKYILFLFIDS